ncbi:3-keto-disaccharide hydrolase [Algibacillus agarilyticus]|uniref:3-keto-disaccharide hydrolase n=1 Tax=Algibacillus agarilyticus TaxID=2234133 RepID=UPI000DD0DAB4|nr:DUF1080 domain-containing protein [Algibacillus agarilyticus]
MFKLKKLAGTLLFSLAIANVAGCANIESNTEKRLDTDLTLWQNVYNDGEAKIVDGEIHLISKGNWFYLTQQPYTDFIFEAEVKMPKTTEYSNSGIIFRAQVGEHPTKGAFAYGYQAEVDPSPRKWSGGLYDQGTPRKWLHPIHPKRSAPDADFKQNLSPEWNDEKANAYKHLEWNKYKIQAKGSDIKIWVNGILTTHVIDTKAKSGFIGIQHHGSQAFKQKQDRSNLVRFRNIVITEL